MVVYPSRSDPQSPRKMRAGLKLWGRNPMHAPKSESVSTIRAESCTPSSASAIESAMNSKPAHAIEVTPESSPSSPSIRLLALHAPSTKNAMIPVITRLVITIPFLFVGSLLLEKFFGIPGLGDMSYTAITTEDFPVIKAVTYFSAIAYIVFNLISDILYAVVDPRVRLR